MKGGVNKMRGFGRVFASQCCFPVWRTSLDLCVIVATLGLFDARNAGAAQEAKSELLLKKAGAAYASGNLDEAIGLATQAIETEPNDVRGYLVRARFHSETHQPAKAIADYDQVLKLQPEMADAWQHRGEEHFRLAQIKQALVDF